MAPASLAMALSIAISLENLPFFAVMLAGLATLFVVDGARMRASMGWFAGGALIAFPACFAATVAPARYLLSACDAYSAVHLAALAVGTLGFAALAALAPRLATMRGRAAAVAVVGAAVIAAIAAIAPKCVGDPLGGLDPLLRELWLSHVTEATPLLKFWDKTPNLVVVMGLPVILGFAAALVEAVREQGIARRRWLLVGRGDRDRFRRRDVASAGLFVGHAHRHGAAGYRGGRGRPSGRRLFQRFHPRLAGRRALHRSLPRGIGERPSQAA